MLFLWISYCALICTAVAMDKPTISRVRNGIRKLPFSIRNFANDGTSNQWITNKIVAPRAKSSSFMTKNYGFLSGGFPATVTPQFQSTKILQNRKYNSHSWRMLHASRLYTSHETTTIPFYHKGTSRYQFGKTNVRPRKRVVILPKMPIEDQQIEFKTSNNSNEITLAPTIDNFNSSWLSSYQQQQQQQHDIYHYKKNFYGSNNPTPYSSSRAEEYDTVQSSLYYNPWDPLGIFNNPFWKSVFPSLFAPQPQLFNSTRSKSISKKNIQGIDRQQGLTLVSKKSSLSPNQKLSLCCKKQNLSPSCQLLCSYDSFTDRSLINAVISNQCVSNELETAFNCATSRADHSECCIRNGIAEYRNGHCMAFCTTHLGNPHNTLQYIDCLHVFDRIKNCYREYHLVNPNIYGDL